MPSPIPPPASDKWILAKNSSIHGRGIYARIPIPQDTRVIEYIGERITKATARKRETERLARVRNGGDGCIYIFVLNRRYDLDGNTENNVARLINHSCAPNCRAQTIKGHIWIIAMREIATGEELTFDYGFPYGQWPFHPCRCGFPKCAGFIVDASQRWRVRKILLRRRNPEAIEKIRQTHADRLKKNL